MKIYTYYTMRDFWQFCYTENDNMKQMFYTIVCAFDGGPVRSKTCRRWCFI